MNTVLSFLMLICLTFLFSCSSVEQEGATEAEVLYNEIKSNYRGKRYLLALEKISSFRSKYPYSYFTTEVELLRADIFYEQQNYLEAVDAYLSFRDFHPNYDKLDVIEWRISESFFNQLPDSVDRDISPALSAIESYQLLIRRYPNSKYVAESRERIKNLEEMIENKELYIANFYYRTHDYQSASYRFNKIIKTARNLEVVKESLVKLVNSYSKLGKNRECNELIVVYKDIMPNSELELLSAKCKEAGDI